MAIRLTTPYYVAGRSAQRWHTNHAERAFTTAFGGGLVAAGLHHASTQSLAIKAAGQKGFHVQPHEAKAFGKAVGFAAGGAAAYGGYHALKAHRYKKSTDAFYTRKRNGKQQRVRKGAR